MWQERSAQAGPGHGRAAGSNRDHGAGKVHRRCILAQAVTAPRPDRQGDRDPDAQGVHNYEPGSTCATSSAPCCRCCSQLTALAFAVHALMDHKFVGHVVMIGVFLFLLVRGHDRPRAPALPVRVGADLHLFGHERVRATSCPTWCLAGTLLDGRRPLLGAVGGALWVRGTPQRFRERLSRRTAALAGATRG